MFINVMDKLTWQHVLVSHPFLQGVTYENVLGVDFYIEDFFVGDSYIHGFRNI